MGKLVFVVQAQYVSGYRIKLRFSDDSQKTVDFSQWLHGEMFRPIRDIKAFRKFFLSGGTVAWANGADIAPETLRAAEDVSATAA